MSNCSTCDGQGNCTLCISNFILNNGICEQSPLCENLNFDNTCLSCVSGYELIQGTC